MAILDIFGALLTLIAILFLGLGGYLAALLLLGREGGRDPLALAVGALAAAIAEGTGIALALGSLGILRLPYALALQALLVVGLLRVAKRRTEDPFAALRSIGRRLWARLRQYPAFGLLVLHAGASEALRGLLRPPLAWDSLMYHLLLAVSWLQSGNLAPVFGRHPVSFYGYTPGNGELWLWWWLAPSHSELYANLAYFPHWLLLGLATGAVARQLGARRFWPLASFLVMLTPTVMRFAATQYVDVPLAALLVAGIFFTVRWIEGRGIEGRWIEEQCGGWGEAALAGACLGVAAGTKVLGLPYALGFGIMALLWTRGWSRRRLAQAAVAVALLVLLGSFFYLRNLAAGVGPVAVVCSSPVEGGGTSAGSSFAGPQTVAGGWAELVERGELVDAFLGVARPASLELGVGPQALLLLPAALLLPWLLAPARRRLGWLLWSQVLLHLFLWCTLPFAIHGHIFANVRYLVGMLALAFAAAVVFGERRTVDEGATDGGRWLWILALALGVQSLLQLHAEMPGGARLTLAVVDLCAVLLLISPRVREIAVRYRRGFAVAAVLALLVAVPAWSQFRLADRSRAFRQEITVHSTPARLFAGAWEWLDTHAGFSPVAVVMEPGNRFLYPAFGSRFERRVTYVNVNRPEPDPAAHRDAASYPGCNPRVSPDPEAWLANLEQQGIVWLHLARQPNRDFPYELGWAEARPERFALRYEDPGNRIYEVLPRQP